MISAGVASGLRRRRRRTYVRAILRRPLTALSISRSAWSATSSASTFTSWRSSSTPGAALSMSHSLVSPPWQARHTARRVLYSRGHRQSLAQGCDRCGDFRTIAWWSSGQIVEPRPPGWPEPELRIGVCERMKWCQSAAGDLVAPRRCSVCGMVREPIGEHPDDSRAEAAAPVPQTRGDRPTSPRLLARGSESRPMGRRPLVSVALSDAETVGGKSYDALNAVPNLTRALPRGEVRGRPSGADSDHPRLRAPTRTRSPRSSRRRPARVLRRSNGITTTYSEVTQAWHASPASARTTSCENFPRRQGALRQGMGGETRPRFHRPPRGRGARRHAVPQTTERPGRRLPQALWEPAHASWTTSRATRSRPPSASWQPRSGSRTPWAWRAGFWGRRGRPGFIAGTLQRWGARYFQGWYVRNLEYALGQPLYAVARERIQRDIVADPQKALDPEALHELERYFERRLREKPIALSESVMGSRPSTYR